MSEPMITIKKADGTFAKVPLSQFKKMTSYGGTPAGSQAAPPIVIPTPKEESLSGRVTNGQGSLVGASLARDDNKPHHQAKHHVAPHHKAQHHAPAHTKSHTEHTKTVHHSAKHISRADAGSLLEEKIPVKGRGVLFSPKREKQVEMVIGKLGFSVAPDLLGRLKSLVLARLKDIKSEDEARELLSRSVKNGGLGLTEPQVEKIITSCREAAELEHGHEIDAPVLKGKTGMLPMVEPMELPAKPREVAPIPYNKMAGEKIISQMINQTVASESVFKLNTQAPVRKSMQDVSAAAAEMGPAEEIKSTSLTDFRRLSGNPEEAARRLQQKMFNLQDESFVLYLDALSAYRLSPLYTEYMSAVCQSLAERKTLASILAMKNSIKLNEVEAIIEMERSL